MTTKVSRRRFVVGLAAAGVLGVSLLTVGYSALRAGASAKYSSSGRQNSPNQASTTTTTTATGSSTIMLVTLGDIVAGKVKSASTTGSYPNTTTTGLNGVMVEVQNVRVVLVHGPSRDTDYLFYISDGMGTLTDNFITENIRFPLRTGPYLVSNPSNGDIINIVGTPYFDADHWEIHPVFAWQPASMGLVTNVCAPAGTVSNTQQMCWSGTS